MIFFHRLMAGGPRRFAHAVLVFSCLLLATACSEPPAPAQPLVRPVKAVQVAGMRQMRERALPGKAKATQEVELSFRVAGPLIALPVKIGDRVRAGEVLARIDPRDFQVALRNVQGQLDEAKAAYTGAKSELDRLERVRRQDPGATSESAIDRAREARDRARANITSLQASFTSAQDALADTYLKAPFDGTVVATYAENFEDVHARQPIVRVLDDSKLEMVVNVPESVIHLIPHVTDIEVVYDAFPERRIPAVVKEMGTEASQTTRTYPVTLIMDQPEDVRILPGMAGKATGNPPPEYVALEGELQIPVSATFAVGDKTFVWVIDTDSTTVRRREITTGQLATHGIRVVSGLAAGEWIATAGAHYLTDNQRVRILQD